MLRLDHYDALLIVTAQGTITKAEITGVFETLRQALDTADRFGMIIDLSGFSDITPEAALADLRFELQMLPHLRKLPKIAIVTQKAWIRSVSTSLGRLIPGVEIACFAPDARDEAEAFARDLPEAGSATPKRGGVRMIEAEDDILAIEIDGYADDAEMEALIAPFAERIASGQELRVLARVVAFRGFDPSILFSRALWSLKLNAARNFKRYAVVSDEAWIKPLLTLSNALTPGEIRLFALQDEAQAWEWVRGRDQIS